MRVRRKKQLSEFPGAATVDYYSNLVFAFAALFMLAILGFNIEKDKAKKEAPPNAALFIVRMEWPGSSVDDVDLYVRDPIDHLVFFRRLADGLMTLDHDDTGANSNEVTMPDGRVVKSVINEEKVEIRGIVPGEYVVNCQMYRKDDTAPTDVGVTLYKTVGEGAIRCVQQPITLSKKGQEETAFRFTLTKDGDVIDVNRLPVRFVGSKLLEKK